MSLAEFHIRSTPHHSVKTNLSACEVVSAEIKQE